MKFFTGLEPKIHRPTNVPVQMPVKFIHPEGDMPFVVATNYPQGQVWPVELQDKEGRTVHFLFATSEPRAVLHKAELDVAEGERYYFRGEFKDLLANERQRNEVPDDAMQEITSLPWEMKRYTWKWWEVTL